MRPLTVKILLLLTLFILVPSHVYALAGCTAQAQCNSMKPYEGLMNFIGNRGIDNSCWAQAESLAKTSRRIPPICKSSRASKNRRCAPFLKTVQENIEELYSCTSQSYSRCWQFAAMDMICPAPSPVQHCESIMDVIEKGALKNPINKLTASNTLKFRQIPRNLTRVFKDLELTLAEWTVDMGPVFETELLLPEFCAQLGEEGIQGAPNGEQNSDQNPSGSDPNNSDLDPNVSDSNPEVGEPTIDPNEPNNSIEEEIIPLPPVATETPDGSSETQGPDSEINFPIDGDVEIDLDPFDGFSCDGTLITGAIHTTFSVEARLNNLGFNDVDFTLEAQAFAQDVHNRFSGGFSFYQDSSGLNAEGYATCNAVTGSVNLYCCHNQTTIDPETEVRNTFFSGQFCSYKDSEVDVEFNVFFKSEDLVTEGCTTSNKSCWGSLKLDIPGESFSLIARGEWTNTETQGEITRMMSALSWKPNEHTNIDAGLTFDSLSNSWNLRGTARGVLKSEHKCGEFSVDVSTGNFGTQGIIYVDISY